MVLTLGLTNPSRLVVLTLVHPMSRGTEPNPPGLVVLNLTNQLH